MSQITSLERENWKNPWNNDTVTAFLAPVPALTSECDYLKKTLEEFRLRDALESQLIGLGIHLHKTVKKTNADLFDFVDLFRLEVAPL
jgi:hypothetical protein